MPSPPATCIVDNYDMFYPGRGWGAGVPALYDSGANLIPGLILLEQFVIDHNFEYVRFDDSIHPPGVNMANGARLSIAGQVPQVDVKIESKVFSFFSVPVFKSLNHPVIFGFSSSTKHGIFYDIDGQTKKNIFSIEKARGRCSAWSTGGGEN